MSAIVTEALHKRFDISTRSGLRREQRSVVAVESLDLSIDSGEAIAFIGPNGAGKSTTIKMLTGILTPTSGTARVLEMVPWRERSQLTYQIGAVFGQRSQLWYHLPPRDTFELLARVYNLEPTRYAARRDMLIDRFGLNAFLDTPVRRLSLGQRMRAEVAASLLHEPRILFLDEPTIGLDVVGRQELRDMIREWNRNEGLTVFLTSHDAGDIEQVAKRVIVINHGRIVFDDRVSTLRRRYLNAKILGVRFHDEPQWQPLAGVDVQKAAEYALKLHVDTSAVSIERVMTQVMAAGAVADIAIEDPPLEEIIAHIYTRAGGEY